MSEWISVKDRLPDDCSVDVLVVNAKGEMETSTYTDNPVGGGWCVSYRDRAFGDITHWMPLPKPPTPDLTTEEALKLAVMDLGLFADHFMGGTKATNEGIGAACGRVVRYREVLERAGKW